MAGTVTRTLRFVFGDTRIEARYTFTYGDEFDGVTDWTDPDDPAAPPSDDDFDLTGDVEVEVVGPGTIHAVLYRTQRQSRNPWREMTLTEADGVQTFSTGGPLKQVSDLRGADAERIA